MFRQVADIIFGRFTQNYGCAVCPFSHTGYEKVQAQFKGNPNAPQFVIPLTT